MVENEENVERKKFFTIIWNNYVSSKIQSRLRNIPLLIFKWQTALLVGTALGFSFCYFYETTFSNAIFDWKVILSIFSVLGACITSFLIMSERIMKLIVEERQFTLVEKKITYEDANKNFAGEKLAKDLLPLLNRKLFQSDTIYELRSKHYAEEKHCIAKHYVRMLEKRLSALLDVSKLNKNNIKKVVFILDSGTTISQVFEMLGKESYEDNNHWSRNFEKVSFHTNSIRGVLCLFKYRDQSSRYSEIPFKCNIFPGEILSPYEAIADIETVGSILNLKKEGSYIIFVTTGNYIMFNRNENAFLPIARAGFHPDVKAAGYCVADEVHVVAPLGKVLMNCDNTTKEEKISETLKSFNDSLDYDDSYNDESKRRYSLISPETLKKSDTFHTLTQKQQEIVNNQSVDIWTKKSILITSRRENNEERRFWLANHSATLMRELDGDFDPAKTTLNNLNCASYVFSCEFDGLPYSTKLQPKIEIPHKNLRDKKILGKFFKVPHDHSN